MGVAIKGVQALGKTGVGSAVLARSEKAIATWMAKEPGVVAKIATKLGLGGGAKATAARVLEAIKNNPVSTLLALNELGDAGRALLDEMVEADPKLKQLAEEYGLLDEKMDSTTPLSEIAKYKEEFAAISEAARILGGYDRLIALHRVINYDYAMFEMYSMLKGMKL